MRGLDGIEHALLGQERQLTHEDTLATPGYPVNVSKTLLTSALVLGVVEMRKAKVWMVGFSQHATLRIVAETIPEALAMAEVHATEEYERAMRAWEAKPAQTLQQMAAGGGIQHRPAKPLVNEIELVDEVWVK